MLFETGKHYKKFNQSGKKFTKAILIMQSFYMKNNNKGKLHFEDKIAENKNNPRELWPPLKSPVMPSKGGRQFKTLKENCVISFKVGLSPSKKFSFICFNDSPSKIMKNAFYFILKALFVLKIFKCLS